MKAIAVLPGKPNSVHLASRQAVARLTSPAAAASSSASCASASTARTGRSTRPNTAPPQGYDFLIIGHEGFGQVEAVGPVTFLRPGDFVVATVRRPGKSLYDAIGLQDMTTDN